MDTYTGLVPLKPNNVLVAAQEKLSNTFLSVAGNGTHRSEMLDQTKSGRGKLSFHPGGKAPTGSDKWTPNMEAVRATIKHAVSTGRLDADIEA